mgnify:CR=1 FL=1
MADSNGGYVTFCCHVGEIHPCIYIQSIEKVRESNNNGQIIKSVVLNYEVKEY